jgi:16S rRNA C967 or C1407 C5-methylase (RsmB/RsmF family)
VVLVVASELHERRIAAARRMLERAGLSLAVAAIAPDERTITGADW